MKRIFFGLQIKKKCVVFPPQKCQMVTSSLAMNWELSNLGKDCYANGIQQHICYFCIECPCSQNHVAALSFCDESLQAHCQNYVICVPKHSLSWSIHVYLLSWYRSNFKGIWLSIYIYIYIFSVNLYNKEYYTELLISSFISHKGIWETQNWRYREMFDLVQNLFKID